MTKPELISKIASKSGMTNKDSGKVLEAFVEVVSESLAKGQNVQLIGFGSFEVHKRDARKGRNPRTGAELRIPSRKVPVFKAGKGLKDSVAKK
jgi:DNA-binding protein HU-beta